LKLRSRGAFALPEGTIYPALHRLERAGLLASGWSNASGRKRRVYKLTARGRRRLDTSKREWNDFASAVDAVLA
jgi:DNA-binding PadR family transcriptional regulator